MRLSSTGPSSEVGLASALVLDREGELGIAFWPRPLRDPWHGLYDSYGPGLLVCTPYISICQSQKLVLPYRRFREDLETPCPKTFYMANTLFWASFAAMLLASCF